MNTTTETEPTAVTKDTNTPAASKSSRKRRMAREPRASNEGPAKPAASTVSAEPAANERGPSKIAAVVALLERKQGATRAEMVEATNWLPHTTRAALTGLKKKGHVIAKDKRDDVTCYHIAKAAE